MVMKLGFAPFLAVPGGYRSHLPRDLDGADLSLAYVRGLSPCRKTAGCDLPARPSRESCAWVHGLTVNQKHRGDVMNTGQRTP
jgi:hypothetical protein